MPVELSLIERIPAGATAGRARAISSALRASLLLKDKMSEAAADRSKTALGQATDIITPYLRTTGMPALLKARRQLAYGQKVIDGATATLRKKATGESRATDAEWRDRLWKMQPNERAKLVLENAAARGPALREPELAGIDSKVFEHALRISIQHDHEREGAILATAQAAQDLQRLAVTELEKSLLSVPAVLWPSKDGKPSTVRPFATALDLQNWIDAALPGQSSKEASIGEQVEVDLVNEP